jgi:hypothetical protein
MNALSYIIVEGGGLVGLIELLVCLVVIGLLIWLLIKLISRMG